MKEQVIDLKKKVTIYGTGKNANMAKGAAFEVHPLHAETLKKKGFATDSAPRE